jgi:hypothetical protein
MSAKNGDKARFQRNRKRAVLRRTKIRELTASLKKAEPQEQDAPKAEAK